MAIRKFELHWDAAAAIVLVVVSSLGFNLYQRYQYRSMIQESMSNLVAAQDMQIGNTLLQRKLAKCEKTAALP